ncbi:unnamed protein product [Heterosigma akashiwo]
MASPHWKGTFRCRCTAHSKMTRLHLSIIVKNEKCTASSHVVLPVSKWNWLDWQQMLLSSVLVTASECGGSYYPCPSISSSVPCFPLVPNLFPTENKHKMDDDDSQ